MIRKIQIFSDVSPYRLVDVRTQHAVCIVKVGFLECWNLQVVAAVAFETSVNSLLIHRAQQLGRPDTSLTS
jgi:hypothetical protein